MQEVVHVIDYQRSIILADNTKIIVCTTCMQINEIKLGFASSLMKIVWEWRIVELTGVGSTIRGCVGMFISRSLGQTDVELWIVAQHQFGGWVWVSAG